MQQPEYRPPIPSPTEPMYAPGPYSNGPMVNTSGQGANAAIPPEVASMGFHWGAFLLTWIWGIGNSVWLALLVFPIGLLSFIPGLGLIAGLGFQIYLGMKGHELAWRNRRFESIEQFRDVQKAWTKWGVIFLVALFVLGILAGILAATLGSHSPRHY